jgi:NTP pyrophosphatase (non-canonical NTP hydrolase)
MLLNEYQQQISEFARYPYSGSGKPEELTYVALGLNGEAGEFAEKVKKLIRDGVFVKEDAAKELGDVMWYTARAAEALGYSLQDIAQMNIDKLTSRKERNVLAGSGDNR